MATKAAQRAIEQAGITAAEIDLIIAATVTPDTFFLHRLPRPAHARARRTPPASTSPPPAPASYGIEVAQQFISNHTYNTHPGPLVRTNLSSIVN